MGIKSNQTTGTQTEWAGQAFCVFTGLLTLHNLYTYGLEGCDGQARNRVYCFGYRYIYIVLSFSFLMDGRTVYSRLMTLITPLDGQVIHLNKLKSLIRMHIASSEKAVEQSLKLLGDVGIIKENPNEPFMYKIDIRGEDGNL